MENGGNDSEKMPVSKPPLPKQKWKPNTGSGRKRKRVATAKQMPIPNKDKGVGGPTIGNKKNSWSWAWDHFTRFEEDGKPRASCNYRDQHYAANPKQHGTSNLINHLENQCKKYPYRYNVDEKQKILAFETKREDDDHTITLKSLGYNYEECREALVEWIIIDEQLFKIVEGEGFKRLVTRLQPKFNLPSRVTIARDCMKLYHDEKKKLKVLIKAQRVCLTTDTWTSIQNMNYMCLTAHWIDKDWRLNKRILNFCIIPNHKGKIIGKMVENCLSEWGINKMLTITVDNASSNDGAINYLKKKINGWKGTILDNKFLHLRCCAHILNLIVKDGLKQQNDSILKIRNEIRYVRSSPARLQSFKKCVEIENIESKSLVCLDIETRWNSTYLMLEAAVKFEKAFERLKEDDSSYMMYFSLGERDNDEDEGVDMVEKEKELGGSENGKGKGKDNKFFGPPDEEDWDVARNFIKFLKLFYDVTLQFSGSSKVTSNTFFLDLVVVQTRLKNLSKHKDPKVGLMAMKMKKKFEKYWESVDKINFLLYVAAVLDPRYKLKFVRFCLDQVYENDCTLSDLMEEKVKNALIHLYDCYKQLDPSIDTKHVPSSSNQASVDMDIDKNVDTIKFLASQFAKHLEENEFSENKSEVARYLGEICEKNVESFDVFRWWKDNSSRYPILAQIAKDVLAIPVSTVASESAFSTSGRILDLYRSSLNPNMVEALVCSHNWLRSKLIDQQAVEEIPMEEIEKYEEILKEFQIGAISVDG